MLQYAVKVLFLLSAFWEYLSELIGEVFDHHKQAAKVMGIWPVAGKDANQCGAGMFHCLVQHERSKVRPFKFLGIHGAFIEMLGQSISPGPNGLHNMSFYRRSYDIGRSF